MGDNYWQATIDAYDGFIDKPKLEEELLKRPPFLFVLHIYLETMKNSEFKFGKCLFEGEQLSRKYYDPKLSPEVDKDEMNTRKENFFKKLLKLVSVVLKENLACNPANIIKGKECDKTNLFLQQMAKAAKMGKDFSSVEKKLLEMFNKKFGGGEDAPQTQKNEPAQEPPAKNNRFTHKDDGDDEPAAKKGSEPQTRFQKNVEDQINKESKAAKQKDDQDDGSKIKMGNLKRNAGTAQSVVPSKSKVDQENAGEDEDGKQGTSIEGLKSLIQKITQSTNPLGKIIEFADDDVESMSKEFQNWARVYENSKSKLEEVEKKIEEDLQTYKDKITTKEEQIREKKSQIQSVKTTLLRNNEKIQKLLQGIVGD